MPPHPCSVSNVPSPLEFATASNCRREFGCTIAYVRLPAPRTEPDLRDSRLLHTQNKLSNTINAVTFTQLQSTRGATFVKLRDGDCRGCARLQWMSLAAARRDGDGVRGCTTSDGLSCRWLMSRLLHTQNKLSNTINAVTFTQLQ